MENSSKIAHKFQLERAASGYMRSLSTNKVTESRKSLNVKEEMRIGKKLQKLKLDYEESIVSSI